MNDALISLFTLTILEIVLGIDNIIFITILAGKTSKEKQDRARTIGMLMGMVVRIILLFGINWIQRQDHTLFTAAGHDFSGMSLLLLAGGLFLLFQSVREIHLKMKGATPEVQEKGKSYSWSALMLQIQQTQFFKRVTYNAIILIVFFPVTSPLQIPPSWELLSLIIAYLIKRFLLYFQETQVVI
jgi:predicted tellurium resistance membrane protein TerC